MNPLTAALLLAALLFSIGLAGALTRRSAILVLIGIELMLNAANLNFIAFWRYGGHPEILSGLLFVLFAIAIAAAEAAYDRRRRQLPGGGAKKHRPPACAAKRRPMRAT